MITGDDFIRIAGKWAADPRAGESVHRTAISRAYYGAFHLARAFLESLGVNRPPGDKRIHSFVRGALLACDVAEARLAGKLLGDHCEHRTKADYRLSEDQWGAPELARLCVEFAHQIKSMLDVCENAGADTHRHMRASIDAWRTRSKL